MHSFPVNKPTAHRQMPGSVALVQCADCCFTCHPRHLFHVNPLQRERAIMYHFSTPHHKMRVVAVQRQMKYQETFQFLEEKIKQVNCGWKELPVRLFQHQITGCERRDKVFLGCAVLSRFDLRHSLEKCIFPCSFGKDGNGQQQARTVVKVCTIWQLDLSHASPWKELRAPRDPRRETSPSLSKAIPVNTRWCWC